MPGIIQLGFNTGTYSKSDSFPTVTDSKILVHFFPASSIGKESTCNAGDPCSILGSGRSAGEGIGVPTPVFLAFLVAQLVKNLPAVWETWV